MSLEIRLSPFAALGAALLLAGCQGASESNDAAIANEAASGLPVRPGVYGNVTGAGGMELQVYGPPRDMLEVTVCTGPCTDIHRAQYAVEGETLTFNYREKQADGKGKVHRFILTQQGEDVAVTETDPEAEPDVKTTNEAAPAPILLKRLPERTALAAAQDAILKRAQ
jgi:hypothetical protein